MTAPRSPVPSSASLTASSAPGLVRGMGVVGATALVAGTVIGTGIFVSPSLVADQVGAPGLSLLVWALCGLLALAGGLCYAELAAALPRTGGQYAWFRRAFGAELPSFLFAWSMFFVVLTGVQAAVATAFAIYAGFFLAPVMEYGVWEQRAVAVACIAFLAVMNILGVTLGGRIQVVVTILKVGALAALVGGGLWLGAGTAAGSLAPLLPEGRSAGAALGAFGTAMIVTLFAYNGWWYSTYVAEEVRDPERNVPRSIFLGMGIVLVLYLLANVVYLSVLPFDVLRGSERPAADVMVALLGAGGGAFIAAAVMVSAFGTVNAQMLSIPRIYFAAARDGLFFRGIRRVHPRYRTPALAIGAQAVWASGFALSGTFRRIVTYTAFPNYFFLSLGVVALIVLRIREPDLPRPYRVFLYPVTPVLFLGVFAWYLVNSVVFEFRDTMVGIALALSGLPFYYLFFRDRPRTGPGREEDPGP
jgi:basic amino acid/polyamine antiporter, APA family